MISEKLREQDFKSRKEYLVAIAIEYIRDHTGFVGIDDGVFLDEVECDGFALADDLEIEFGLGDFNEFDEELLKARKLG